MQSCIVIFGSVVTKTWRYIAKRFGIDHYIAKTPVRWSCVHLFDHQDTSLNVNLWNNKELPHIVTASILAKSKTYEESSPVHPSIVGARNMNRRYSTALGGGKSSRILGRQGNGPMVGHHICLLVESPDPRSQSTIEWMRSSGQIGVLPADRILQGHSFY